MGTVVALLRVAYPLLLSQQERNTEMTPAQIRLLSQLLFRIKTSQDISEARRQPGEVNRHESAATTQLTRALERTDGPLGERFLLSRDIPNLFSSCQAQWLPHTFLRLILTALRVVNS